MLALLSDDSLSDDACKGAHAGERASGTTGGLGAANAGLLTIGACTLTGVV